MVRDNDKDNNKDMATGQVITSVPRFYRSTACSLLIYTVMVV